MIEDHRRTVLIIDDCAEDREVYHRALRRDPEYIYEIWDFETAQEALQWCHQQLPDLILVDFMLPDISGLEFIEELKLAIGGSNNLPIIMLTGQGDESVAVQAIKNGAQDYFDKSKLTAEILCRASHAVMKRVSLIQQIEQQQQQQQLIRLISLRIRQSLNLESVLKTAVDEIRRFLKCDRAIVYQNDPTRGGIIVAESVLPEWLACLHLHLEDNCFHKARGHYPRGYRHIITDIQSANKSSLCYLELLEQFQIKAVLAVPIFSNVQQLEFEAQHQPDQYPTWGLLVLHQCYAPRQWQQWEIDLLEELAVQLAIAIQQAELYQSLQTLNTQLEQRTKDLEQDRELREAIFNESTDAIFLVDAYTLRTIDCNCRAIELFEAECKEKLIGIEGHTLQRQPFTPQEMEMIVEVMEKKGCWSQEIGYITFKGRHFWGHLTAKQIHVAGKRMNLIHVGDISDRQQAMEQLRISLEEKETLLKEIHHRVKNNLQIISSLLRMQSRRSLDQSTMMLFQESQNRVQSMALIHEHLYRSPEISQVDFGEYVCSLTDNLFRCYGVSQKTINLKVEANNFKLSLDTAIPCGLLINELVSNSLKYAFPNRKQCEILIRLESSAENLISLTISDNGVGISKDLDWQNSHSLGLRIVQNLVKQLKGSIILNLNNGTTFYISFPKTLKSLNYY